MKTFSLVVMMSMLSLNSVASEILLRCTVSFGELQEITVLKESNKYYVQQLNNAGSMSKYQISAREWKNKKIDLDLKWEGPAYIAVKNGQWIFRSEFGGIPYLDCR